MSQNLKLIKSKYKTPTLTQLGAKSSSFIEIESHYFEANNTSIDSLLESIRKLIGDNRITGNFTIHYNLGRVCGAKFEISSSS